MILAHKHLKRYCESGKIHCDPYDPELVGTNSIDVRLGHSLKYLSANSYDDLGRLVVDHQIKQITIDIGPALGGWTLLPGVLYLGHTIEEIGSDYFVPIYETRSSIARMGIQTHAAGFGDLGFKRQWTLEITVVMPTVVYPGMRIGQVYFVKPSDRSVLYGRDIPAHYANQAGPTESKYGEKI